MGSLPAPSTDTGTTRRPHRPRRLRRDLARLWRGWWVEIIIACLLGLALFLLVERMNIRQTLYAGLLSIVGRLKALLTAGLAGLRGLISSTTLSDLIAYLLLAAVVVLIAWRTRGRLVANPRLADMHCPVCGGGIHRIHRRWHERLVGIVFPVRRYACGNSECGWIGLRVRQVR